jgi:hypothetical protein
LALMSRWIFLVHCCFDHVFEKKIRQPAVFFFINICISGLKCGSSSR